LTFYISGQILSWTRNICNENLTRTIKLIGSSWFLLLLLLPRQICNSLYRDRASTRNKTLYTLTCYLLPISIVPRHSYSSQNLYPDGKNHAVPSLHPMTLAFSSVRTQGVTVFWLKNRDPARCCVR
jgi:hypothetical protein